MTLAKGHHAQTRRTARNLLIFHTVAVRLNNKRYIIMTGEDDIARFDSRRYSNLVCSLGSCNFASSYQVRSNLVISELLSSSLAHIWLVSNYLVIKSLVRRNLLIRVVTWRAIT
jgi:hypothetical protein